MFHLLEKFRQPEKGIGVGIDIATMHGLDLLATENKIKAVSNLGGDVAIPEQCHRNRP